MGRRQPGARREHLTVRRAATRVRVGMSLNEPKTRKGRRQIPLMADTVHALELQKARCQELRRAAVEWVPNDHDLVFPNESGARCATIACSSCSRRRNSPRGSVPRARFGICGTPARRRTSESDLTCASRKTFSGRRSDVTLDTCTRSVPAATAHTGWTRTLALILNSICLKKPGQGAEAGTRTEARHAVK
jgi:hypothetical protein